MDRDDLREKFRRDFIHHVSAGIYIPPQAIDAWLSELPPCACGSKEPLAEVEVFVEKDEIQHLIAGASQIYFGLETTPRPNEIPVRILVFDLPGGKPDDE